MTDAFSFRNVFGMGSIKVLKKPGVQSLQLICISNEGFLVMAAAVVARTLSDVSAYYAVLFGRSSLAQCFACQVMSNNLVVRMHDVLATPGWC